MTLRLTHDDVRALVAQGRIAPADLPPDVRLMAHRGRTKSGKRADLNGLYVRSSWEANYARWLNSRFRPLGLLSWRYEPCVFRFPGLTRGCIEYRPDFELVFDHRTEFHEVKGYMNLKSKTRLKRMAQYHPHVLVTVIGRAWFVEMERSGRAGAIPGWERL